MCNVLDMTADHVEKKVYQLQIRHLQKPKACTISILPPRTRGIDDNSVQQNKVV